MSVLLNDVLSVDEMTSILKRLICSAGELQNISIRGELTGFKRHSSGHIYFNLLGKNSRVACVMFRSYATSLLTWAKDGDEVLLAGKLDLYPARGSYQFYATAMVPIGAGAKARQKAFLKKKLEEEGLFAPERKRRLPRLPGKVVVITSPTSAALQDVLKISQKRYPLAEILIIPSLMQGDLAKTELLNAFRTVLSISDVDVVLVVRGGGAREDLDVFDDELVVRNLHSLPVPVVTGLGHQIDLTLCDLVADKYTPTPSGAAEVVFPDQNDIQKYLNQKINLLTNIVISNISRKSDNINNIQDLLTFNLNKNFIEHSKFYLSNYRERIVSLISSKLSLLNSELAYNTSALHNVSPLKTIARGYAIVEDKNKKRIKSIDDLIVGENISLLLHDGKADVTVNTVKP